MVPINIEYRWQPIEDYEDDPQILGVPELRALPAVWLEQKALLEQQDGLRAFNQRLRREWAIETGLLERIYVLDRGVTQLLIEHGISAELIPHDVIGQDPRQVVAVLRDHEAAVDMLFDFVKGARPLTNGFIKELHALLTRNQEACAAVDSLGRNVQVPLTKGAFKRLPNNPSREDGIAHEYCPPEHVDSEMDRLLGLHAEHEDVAPEVEAAWLHHRFTQIHPFQDGNGRVARALATLVFIKANWFPLVIRDLKSERTRYLDALEQADFGDLRPLVAVFAAAQRRAFVEALGISSQVLKLHRVDEVISATRQQLETRETARREEWKRAEVVAGELEVYAIERFRSVVEMLRTQTDSYLQATFRVDSATHGDPRAHFFRWQIIQAAKALGYFANLSGYRTWVRLVLETENRAEVLVSFHGIGPEFRGILGASACFFRREQTEQGDREVTGVTPISSEIFQVNYKEPSSDARTRFEGWLEEVLVNALETWRKGL